MNFHDYLDSASVVICDGGFGTLANERMSGKGGYPCSDILNLTHPDVVLGIHRDYVLAGANIIETNTFGANRITLAEHGLSDKVKEINLAAVRIARSASQQVCKSASRRKSRQISGSAGLQTCRPVELRTVFIAGDLGPTSKLPTLGHVSFDELVDAYTEQAGVLIEGGVDLFQIDTCQDILQAKAAVIAIRSASQQVSRFPCRKNSKPTFGPADLRTCRPADIPIIVTVTIEKNETMLTGTEIEAAYTALAPLGITAFGLNCATGPAEMEPTVRRLAKIATIPIAVLPNAGLPHIRNGRACYNLSTDEFAKWAGIFVRELGVKLIGGCCGTTPGHIKTVSKLLSSKVPKSENKNNLETYKLRNLATGFISSTYSSVSIDQEPRPLIIGERMNINGSKEFREHLLAGNFDAAAAMAKRQAESGAHVLDLSVAYAGRDEVKDMQEMARRLATVSPLPIMIDSTSPSAVEAGLKCLGGRSIINSINLEDGGKKAAAVLSLAKKFGAAVVALTIDEKGMALTAKKKLMIAKRLIDAARGFTDTLFVDLLTFTLADPKSAEAGSGWETLNALKLLNEKKKAERRGLFIRTLLGVSNVSYGLSHDARRVLNSVFLHEAVKYGLDAAIVHPKQILPLHKIDKEASGLALDLIYCKDKKALNRFMEYFDGLTEKGPGEKKRMAQKVTLSKGPPEERLRTKIIDGDRHDMEAVILEVLKKITPQDAINNILLPAMKKVGEMFGAGELALPFVLQSAETMRLATDILTPHLKKGGAPAAGTMVLATVVGDVHDIGKNLVDIIVSNNGYKVVNLGVKQPVENIMRAAKDHKADAIGLSGLLVQSCLVMKENLIEMARAGMKVPVICGGAALTKKFVESDLSKAYNGRVYYAKDAFDGLKIMQTVTSG